MGALEGSGIRGGCSVHVEVLFERAAFVTKGGIRPWKLLCKGACTPGRRPSYKSAQ